MRESAIEKYLNDQVKKIGGKTIKMLPTFENGIPDRLVLYKGKSPFVEMKAPGEEPRKLQVEFGKELEKHGFTYLVIDTKEKVDQFCVDLQRGYRYVNCKLCDGSGQYFYSVCGICAGRGQTRKDL